MCMGSLCRSGYRRGTNPSGMLVLRQGGAERKRAAQAIRANGSACKACWLDPRGPGSPLITVWGTVGCGYQLSDAFNSSPGTGSVGCTDSLRGGTEEEEAISSRACGGRTCLGMPRGIKKELEFPLPLPLPW